jgi:hypothetical protein
MHITLYPCDPVSTCRIWLCTMCMSPSIHVHGCVSMCTAMYPHAHGHVSTWTAMYPSGQNFVKHYCMCHSAGFCYALCATAQNFIKCCGPQCRMIDHYAESHELQLKTCLSLERNSEEKMFPFINCTTQGLFHPCLKSLLLRKKIFWAEDHCAEWYSDFNISSNSKSNFYELVD